MDQRSLSILEYDKIIEQLAGMAHTEPGRRLCARLEPVNELAAVEKAQAETDDAVKWLLDKGSLPFTGISDISQPVMHSCSGAVLTCADLMHIGQFLRAVSRLHRLAASDMKSERAVEMLLGQLQPLRYLEKELDQAIAGEDELHDAASQQLALIRRRIRSAQNDVKDSLSRILRSKGRFLQDQLVTMRGNRYVVPLKAEHRGELPGIVHDTSASGATLFVEPLPVVELNNKIRELMGLEREEIERILLAFSDQVAQQADPILANLDLVSRLDFLLAKGSLALKMKAMPPRLNQEGRIILKSARHPLIPADRVVPIDFELGTSFQTLVITGPNTGGKTVSLKTCGLFCVMAMAGLQIPANDGSQISVFSQVLADIGDEQSIEQDLSTFSSHMRNLVQITAEAGPGMLILVDELGSGTDPSEGAALAIAILDHLRQRGCQAVATTHYKELKAYALRTDNVENACCEFDTETLMPTYRLLIGVPGVSNAFVISRRLGLSEEIISQARQLLSEEGIRFEELIAAVEKQNRDAETLRRETERLKELVAAEKVHLADARKELASQKRKILAQAREEAREAYQGAQAEVEKLLQQIREQVAQDQLSQSARMADQVRQQIRTGLGEIEKEIGYQTLRPRGGQMDKASIKPGIRVTASALGLTGKIVEGPDNRGNCLLLSDQGVRISVSADALQLAEVAREIENETRKPGRTARSPRQKNTASQSISMQRSQTAQTEIKLLGQTVEEALSSLDKFLDDAVLGGIGSVRIVHGKGTGALRSAVHQVLKRDPRVIEFRLGAYGEGDSGVTLAQLK
jgi:DNA mismatch repair protein MutS2